ncbi:hypothetical protein TGAMA5MH_10864 [Trichoderma gamsii]|uniref:Uncharacterized protein n=1 Tax=Trichoderma gamsii TaxID=398673 RepID=A0A2K0SVD5_9HYPO|nr:hypothetical protein TGAMA5MH_10864 [Trichoderma gamsii]
MRLKTADDKCIKEALYHDEYRTERGWGYGREKSYWNLIRSWIKEWG